MILLSFLHILLGQLRIFLKLWTHYCNFFNLKDDLLQRAEEVYWQRQTLWPGEKDASFTHHWGKQFLEQQLINVYSHTKVKLKNITKMSQCTTYQFIKTKIKMGIKNEKY